MTRMIFVPNPHVRLDRSWAAPYIPPELLGAMAVAEAAGAEPALFDVNWLVEHGSVTVGPDLWEQAARLLCEAEPDLVLFETWTGTLHNTLQLAEQARPLLPLVPFVLLGAGTSAVAEEVLGCFDYVDGVICGEPEPAVERLAKRQRQPLPSAPGLFRRTARGIDCAALAWVEHLEELPRPAYHLALIQPGDSIPVESGRGCGQGCSFCTLAGHWPDQYRAHTVERVVDEMVDLADRFPGSMLDLSADPVFFTDPDRARTFCRQLAAQDLPVSWSCVCRSDRLDEGLLAEMARAGCRGILMGVETGCPELQRRIGKCVDLEHLESIVTSAVRLDIGVRASFILGLPGEDAPALARTVNTLLKVRAAGADTAVEMLRAYPGSAVHKQYGGALEPEELLCTASSNDVRGRDLISRHSRLLPASHRVPGQVAPECLLATWVALTCLPDVVYPLWQSGLEAETILSRLKLKSPVHSLETAAQQVAHQLELLAAKILAVDHQSLRDLIAYQLGLFTVGLAPGAEPADNSQGPVLDPDRLPDEIAPFSVAPWQLFTLRTNPELLVDSPLCPAGHQQTYRVLVAKVWSDAEPTFYTRRAHVVESFVVDEVGATLLPLLDQGHDLLTCGRRVSNILGTPPSQTVEACREVVSDLTQSGVLAVR